ncbi:MAG: hypothetical protein NTY53_23935, partial [Kiritimatiellaeota bacterium]|nr:hypothetical protein [Kiritimatiellota bacterium]
MSSGFKNYHFHREYHNDLMKNQAYVMLPLDCIGALAKLRNLAGLTDNSGSLRIGGSARLTFKEVCKWLAQTPEVTARRVRAILFRLVFDKFLTAVTPKGEAIELQRAAGEWLVPGRIDMDEAVVMVPNWDTEQHERAPSSEAERKRTQREREEERERESGRDEVFEEDFRRKSEENLSDGSTGVRE